VRFPLFSFLASLFFTALVQKITGIAAVCTPFTLAARRAVVWGAQLPATHGKVALSSIVCLPDASGHNHAKTLNLL